MQAVDMTVHDRQRCPHAADAAHLATVRLRGDVHATCSALSPCGRFAAVSTPDATELFGILSDRRGDGGAQPAADGGSAMEGADDLRVARIALPDSVPAAAALAFGPPPASVSPNKRRRGGGAARPAFRLYAATASGRVLLLEPDDNGVAAHALCGAEDDGDSSDDEGRGTAACAGASAFWRLSAWIEHRA